MQNLQLTHIMSSRSEADESYRVLRLRYRQLAKNAEQDFLERFPSTFYNVEQAEERLVSSAREYLRKAVDYAIRDLIGNGIIDVDDGIFIEHYSENDMTWDADTANFREAYRSRSRRGMEDADEAGGGRVVGGGFGLEGAAQGVVIAALANTALGLAGRAMGAASGALLTAEIKRSLGQLLAHPSAKAELANAVHNLVFKTHLTLANIVNRRADRQVFALTTAVDDRTSLAISNNLSRIPTEGRREAILMAIAKNPYSWQPYAAWRDAGYDSVDTLEALVAHFDVDIMQSPGVEEQPTEVATGLPVSEDDGLREGMLDLLKNYHSDDLYVGEIPTNKASNACKKYFNSAAMNDARAKAGLEGDICLRDDHMLALVDATIFGSAEHGLALSPYGMHFHSDDGIGYVSWDDLARGKIQLIKSMFGIKFGNRYSFSMSGTKVKKDYIIALLTDVAGYYKSHKVL